VSIVEPIPASIAEPSVAERSVDRLFASSTLNPRVKLEPLMGRWALWPHLMPPAQFALNLAFRLLPGLRSFIENPAVHATAARTPTLFGGPFVALSEEDQLPAVELLGESTRKWRHLLEFAEALKAFDAHLQATAAGSSLDDYYEKLPECLAGLVELVYDLNNHPRLRLIEALMYESPLDDVGAQGFCLHLIDDAQRPFFMNTPLLDAPHRLFFETPYTDPVIDQLAAARIERGIPRQVQGLLTRKCPSSRLLSQWLTQDEPVRVSPDYDGDHLRIRYFGHACVLLQTRRVSVLVDPCTAWQRDEALARFTYSDLPDFIDYAVISHGHHDHLVAETLIQLRQRIGCLIIPPCDRGNLADPSMRLMLQRLGFEKIVTLEQFSALPIFDGEILSVPFSGEHGDLDVASKHCILVRIVGQQILFMVDSDAIDPALLQRVAARVGPVDVTFLGMECCGAPVSWVYGPLFTQPLSRKNDQSRRFSGSNCDRAWIAINTLRCREVFVYAMGQEPWVKHLMGLEYEPDAIQLREAQRFVSRCNQAGIRAQCLQGCYEEIRA
jgi:L-ascorbate metabolism protein UlaG (beta-lactamase superfamily)